MLYAYGFIRLCYVLTCILFPFSFLYFQSTKCKKFIRLSPSSKKKHSKSRSDGNGSSASTPSSSGGVTSSENGMAKSKRDQQVPNGLNDSMELSDLGQFAFLFIFTHCDAFAEDNIRKHCSKFSFC